MRFKRTRPVAVSRPANDSGYMLRFAALLIGALALLWAGTARAQEAQNEPVRIVGLGDSLMAGYDLGPDEGFVPVLQRELTELGQDVEVIQAGVSGDTSTGGRERLEWSVPENSDIVIVELGGNDALRGIAPDVTRANIEAIINDLRVRGQRPILAGILAPPNMGAAYEEAFNTIFPEVAQDRNVPLYPFFLDGAITVPGMMLADGIHPSAAGVEVMVERFIPTLLPVIEEVRAEREGTLVPGPNTQPPLDPAVPAATMDAVPEIETPQAPVTQ